MSWRLHVGLLLGAAASGFHQYLLKRRPQEGRGVLQLLDSTEPEDVHGAPCPSALWWEGTISVLGPGPPALPAVLRHGHRPTGAPSAGTKGPQKQLSIAMAPCGPKNKSRKRPAQAKT